MIAQYSAMHRWCFPVGSQKVRQYIAYEFSRGTIRSTSAPIATRKRLFHRQYIARLFGPINNSWSTYTYFVYFKSKRELNYDRFVDLNILGAARLVHSDLRIYRISFFLLDIFWLEFSVISEGLNGFDVIWIQNLYRNIVLYLGLKLSGQCRTLVPDNHIFDRWSVRYFLSIGYVDQTIINVN